MSHGLRFCGGRCDSGWGGATMAESGAGQCGGGQGGQAAKVERGGKIGRKSVTFYGRLTVVSCIRAP